MPVRFILLKAFIPYGGIFPFFPTLDRVFFHDVLDLVKILPSCRPQQIYEFWRLDQALINPALLPKEFLA
jgi:hypothetical protein